MFVAVVLIDCRLRFCNLILKLRSGMWPLGQAKQCRASACVEKLGGQKEEKDEEGKMKKEG